MTYLRTTPNTHAGDRPRSSHRRGFTLVEIMVVLVVVSILAGITMVGIASARESARVAQTRGLVSRINEVLLNKWDEYRYRVLPVQLDPASVGFGSDTATPPQLLPEEAGRIRLMMLRDLMRMELPDRGRDLFVPSSDPPAYAQATPIAAVVSSFGTGMVPIGSTTTLIPWYPPDTSIPGRPQTTNATLRRYQNIVETTVDASPIGNGDGTLSLAEYNAWIAENESAECLYLVMSTITNHGIPALDLIAPYQIDDTDGDGMREIVDSWGNPISWIRWPSGSSDSRIDPTVADEFDILGSDWGAELEGVELAYSLVPQVIAPGPDGALGLITTETPVDAGGSGTPQPYQLMPWPGAATNNGLGGHIYIDPFDRAATGGINTSGTPTPDRSLRPGAYLPGGREFAADNISSFAL